MKSKNKQLITIIIASLVFISLYRFLPNKNTKNIQAVGDLEITYNGVPLGDPIFSFTDYKPGDCATRVIDVVNNGTTDAKISVKSANEIDIDQLSTQLTIVVREGSTDLYGGSLGEKRLSEFFADSLNEDGIPLSTLGSGMSTSYEFEVCFDWLAGNKFQETSVIFDLVFGEISQPGIPLPDICKPLQGIITEKIVGTEGDDVIQGTTASELIIAKGGNDQIDPSSGSDCIIAGDGDDYVQHTTGNDIIVGGNGNDRLEGGSGIDTIYGGPGNDIIDGGKNGDTIYGGAGDDKIDAGSGNDVIFGGDGNDEIEGGNGSDILRGNAGDDILNGGSGNDYLHGGLGFDKLNGDSGTDTCVAGEDLSSCEI